MSADSDSALPTEPNSPSITREKLPVPPAKRRYRRDLGPENDDGAQESVPNDDPLLEEIEVLNDRVRRLTAKLNTTSREPSPQVPQETRTVKYFRLERKQAAPAAPRDAATSTAAAGEAARADLPTAAPVVLPPPPPPAIHYGPWRDTTWHPGWLLATAGILALGLLTFFLGQYSVRPVAAKQTAPVAAPATWTTADTGQLNKIIAVDRDGHLDEAYREALSLNQQLGTRLGLTLYAASLQARAGGLNNAEADLVRVLDANASPLAVAAVQTHLGFIYARRRDFNAAQDAFAAAAAANPFDPLTFYRWGEAQRRAGRLLEAVGKFRQTLLRLPTGEPEVSGLRECVGLRLRLTQIELGDDAEVKTALDEQLRQPVPSVYWLLTAVAYSLQHNDPTAALAAAERARVLTAPAEFDLLCNDYYLRSLASRTPAMAAFAPAMTAERRARLEASMAYFIDP